MLTKRDKCQVLSLSSRRACEAEGSLLVPPQRIPISASAAGVSSFNWSRPLALNSFCHQFVQAPRGADESSPAGTAGDGIRRDLESRQGRLITGRLRPRQIAQKRSNRGFWLPVEIRYLGQRWSAVPNGTLCLLHRGDPAVPAGLFSIAPGGAGCLAQI